MAFLGLLIVIALVYYAIKPCPPPKKLRGGVRTNVFAEDKSRR